MFHYYLYASLPIRLPCTGCREGIFKLCLKVLFVLILQLRSGHPRTRHPGSLLDETKACIRKTSLQLSGFSPAHRNRLWVTQQVLDLLVN